MKSDSEFISNFSRVLCQSKETQSVKKKKETMSEQDMIVKYVFLDLVNKTVKDGVVSRQIL